MTQYNANTHSATQDDFEHLKATAQREAHHLGDRVREEAYAYLRRKQQAAALTVRHAAHSLRETTDQDTDGSPLTSFARPVADTIEQSADRLEAVTPEEAVAKVEQVARANPAAFALGAAAIGFLAARFLSASTPTYTQEEMSDD